VASCSWTGWILSTGICLLTKMRSSLRSELRQEVSRFHSSHLKHVWQGDEMRDLANQKEQAAFVQKQIKEAEKEIDLGKSVNKFCIFAMDCFAKESISAGLYEERFGKASCISQVTARRLLCTTLSNRMPSGKVDVVAPLDGGGVAQAL